MTGQNLITEGGNPIGAAAAAAAASIYVGEASMTDVLFEQLEYLLGHAGRDCPSGCPDCARLKQVEDCLLSPFHSDPIATLRAQ